MAKRKRLEMPVTTNSADLETKSAIPPAPRARMPIADVAGDTAGLAALEEVAREMTTAEEEGRVVKRLPLAKIVTHHLSRDRLVIDADEMEVLKTSMAARGQQTPIEVVQTSNGFGLISGMRRVEALRALGKTEVLALVRRPDTASAAYVAMVEENEIRSPLSFYERANVAITTVGAGVYPNPDTAVRALFANVSPAKRSKILRFVLIRDKLGKTLKFPAAIPEKVGLAMAKAIDDDAGFVTRLKDALRKTPPEDVAAERRTIERALKSPKTVKASGAEEIAPGLKISAQKGRVVLTGKAVDDAFLETLRNWAISHAKT